MCPKETIQRPYRHESYLGYYIIACHLLATCQESFDDLRSRRWGGRVSAGAANVGFPSTDVELCVDLGDLELVGDQESVDASDFELS